MNSRIVAMTNVTRVIPSTGVISRWEGHWIDLLGRPLRDLRISVTDRCNFRCRYCMPKEKFGDTAPFLARTELLSLEEMERIARITVLNGVEKIRLTGGEPLLRRNIENLVSKLTQLKTVQGQRLDVAMTTNGSALLSKSVALAKAGLSRITVSLDALDETIFKSINGVGFPVSRVVDGILAAQDAGIQDIKVNCVVKKGVNEQEVLKLVERFRHTGIIVRFIEYMDVGMHNGWKINDVVPNSALIQEIQQHYPIEPLNPNHLGEVATRWRYKDGAGEIGFISSVTQPFCHDCSRMRLSVDGKIYRCLFSSEGFDLRQMLRWGASDSEIAEAIGHIWSTREDHYSEIRNSQLQKPTQRRIEMSYIGG